MDARPRELLERRALGRVVAVDRVDQRLEPAGDEVLDLAAGRHLAHLLVDDVLDQRGERQDEPVAHGAVVGLSVPMPEGESLVGRGATRRRGWGHANFLFRFRGGSGGGGDVGGIGAGAAGPTSPLLITQTSPYVENPAPQNWGCRLLRVRWRHKPAAQAFRATPDNSKGAEHGTPKSSVRGKESEHELQRLAIRQYTPARRWRGGEACSGRRSGGCELCRRRGPRRPARGAECDASAIPDHVWDEVEAASRLWRELHTQSLEVRFDTPGATDRVVASLCDLETVVWCVHCPFARLSAVTTTCPMDRRRREQLHRVPCSPGPSAIPPLNVAV